MLEELKHSIRVYLLITRSPSPQLATFLMKIVDFLDDEDQERRRREMGKLALHIVVGSVLLVQKLMQHQMESAADDPPLRLRCDELIVAIGKTRRMDDPIAAKNFLLKTMADGLRELSGRSKITFPAIADCAGNPL